MARPKHPRKELEAILVVIEDEGGWRVDKPGKYFRCRCPCGQHSKYVHLTPSNPRHGDEALRYCKRQSCWGGEQK